jgi:predicted nucleotidyltransferase
MVKVSERKLKIIKRFISKAKEEIEIDKVILFGSVARGKQKK